MKKLLILALSLNSLAAPAFASCQVDFHVKADGTQQQANQFRWTPNIIKFLGATATAMVSTGMLGYCLKSMDSHDRGTMTFVAPVLVPAMLISAALATRYSAAIFQEIERRIADKK